MTTTAIEYLSAAETAKLIRAALKRSFPSVRFWVRSQTYAGGASIDVYYDGLERYEPGFCHCPMTDDERLDLETRGLRSPGDVCRTCGSQPRWSAIYRDGTPELSDVESIAGAYAGGGFDGSIDMAYSSTVYLDADGNVVGGASSGTEGSRGYVRGYDTADTYRTASRAVRTVRPLADFVFTHHEPPYGVTAA